MYCWIRYCPAADRSYGPRLLSLKASLPFCMMGDLCPMRKAVPSSITSSSVHTYISQQSSHSPSSSRARRCPPTARSAHPRASPDILARSLCQVLSAHQALRPHSRYLRCLPQAQSPTLNPIRWREHGRSPPRASLRSPARTPFLRTTSTLLKRSLVRAR